MKIFSKFAWEDLTTHLILKKKKCCQRTPRLLDFEILKMPIWIFFHVGIFSWGIFGFVLNRIVILLTGLFLTKKIWTYIFYHRSIYILFNTSLVFNFYFLDALEQYFHYEEELTPFLGLIGVLVIMNYILT